MIAPLATVVFLATLWLVAKLMLDWAVGDGAKIVAALGGRSMLARPLRIHQISVRVLPRAVSVRRPVQARPEWRAAA